MPLAEELIKIFLLTAMSFAFAMALTPVLTHYLYKYQLSQRMRTQAWDGTSADVYLSLHKKKEGTPSMGGLLVWVTAAILTVFFNLSRSQTWLPLFALIATGFLGLIDDLLNVKGISAVKGLSIKLKFLFQFLIAGAGAWWFYVKLGFSVVGIPGASILHLPAQFDIGWWYIPTFMLVVVFITNAVNITDGLDGLAGGIAAICFGAYMSIAWLQGQFGLAAFCGTIVGSLLAFLWFNIYPARFFMGDTGSFALGATLGVVAFLTNTVLLLPVIGFIFFLEAASSLLQRFSKHFFRKKLFISAPLHHHLEALGWPETKVTMRFWVVGVVVAVVGVVLNVLK
ncbi:MAG: phospho-N-acetylmuramoyl-pentapeptide-transferase [Candidatus Doudnabacteria bacterium RIFCSPHIGHO2_01_FULL_50_11]|uniref:Phospho-N-acetylmuramoyl-pentapeptide-transferase n=1 Tax=Candidatus Doudnabacteria bacterium RIFCSPHIGHO2_01_FULL_50_11 TaxID=1817828 RepID=A0A1F5PKQ3_9BACT|nr:MAG: phospho-N-acetylmuramoyl-pentapeptide-transferase [Candidatus Doudnabacteria bacterium RIFCSPHIGHO2_01_FULL_50_11]HLC44691.1 phospho-N-acetylmuramoyl-pentapeptide-transferase [Patescibacteria group bacterium]